MKANETKVQDFFSQTKTQFVIPIYQRNYDWSESQCKQLLDDIVEVGANKNMKAHFIGSIVYIHDDVYTSSRIKELTIIDGQQRLTTLTLIYSALSKLTKELNNIELSDDIIETYLINKRVPEEEKLKLRPNDHYEKALKYLLSNNSADEYHEFSKIIDNFNYLKGRINKDNYEIILFGLSKLMFVEISLDRNNDDHQRIFESLNSTGLKLSEADLIRNYILMGLMRNDQNKIYQNYWEVIEQYIRNETTNNNYVSAFIRDYLTLENKKIPNKEKVYIEFKAKFPISTVQQLEINLTKIKSFVQPYNKLINPHNESDREISLELEYINRLEINVAYPFLMKVYNDYNNLVINKTTFIEILQLIQSLVWRRSIVGLPTNSLNKIFMNLYDKIDIKNYLVSIQKALLQKAGSQRFPKNSETKEYLKTKDVYNIKPKNRIYMLEKLENYQNKEFVTIDGNNDITVEHIFPQNPDAKWKIELGNDEYKFHIKWTPCQDRFLLFLSYIRT